MYLIGKTDALIVIDMENDFCLPSGKLHVAGVPGEATMENVIVNCASLAADYGFGYVAANFDIHEEGHVEFRIYGEHVLKGSDGAKYVDLLADPEDWADLVLVKGLDRSMISYSIAVSPDFPLLVRTLRARGIERIFVVGIAYTHCAGESAIALATQSDPTDPWGVFIVRDATRSVPTPYGDPDLMARKLACYGVKEIFMRDLA